MSRPLLIAGRQAPELLVPIHQPLDLVPLAVEEPIEWPCAAFILPAGNGKPDAVLARVLPDFSAAVPLIADDAVGPAFRTTAPAPLHRPASHELGEDHGLMPLARRRYHGE
jgi:hypothetical protein